MPGYHKKKKKKKGGSKKNYALALKKKGY